MVKFVTLVAALAGMSTAAMAAPTSSVTITVKNNCEYPIQVNQLTNNQGPNANSVSLAAGSSTPIHVPSNWGGRIWARKNCTGQTDCQPGAPASLAELLLNGANNQDYYDVSFVDGFNLPISITPNGVSSNGHNCGAPTCSSLPSCPAELQAKDAEGNVIACKSACTAFGTPEYCCTGEYGTPDVCKANKYSIPVKNACPDVYTYAYDDSTSMYACSNSKGYTVTFCPA
ncbi:thaumatin [Cokeromyces recurvatus]|uniref:thaumatin n=1 Tax=Cokeromyces recurvatus TaxID=90255 RepID=UPI00221FE987|nr:thaumatin [Cokeromyces recurvatus]KAI7902688.1 thaumatin [Cokeromyces recurvatus]